jgi:hypothetical protein
MKIKMNDDTLFLKAYKKCKLSHTVLGQKISVIFLEMYMLYTDLY